jgi:hypothetical protein
MAKKSSKKGKKGKNAGGSRAFTDSQIFKALAASEPFLGRPRAIVIVCTCARTTPVNIGRTLADLGVAPGPFQLCVSHGVRTAGYHIALEAVPNSPDTRLVEVINVIQHAPRA